MGVGAGLYTYDVVVKSSRSLSHLLVSSLYLFTMEGIFVSPWNLLLLHFGNIVASYWHIPCTILANF